VQSINVINVIIADDHALLRNGLRSLINSQSDMRVIGEAGNGADLLQLPCLGEAQVLTLDITMPGPSAPQIVEQCRRDWPHLRILVLTMHNDLAYLRTMLAAGCAGYATKSSPLDELITAIRLVHAGQSYIDAQLRDPSLASGEFNVDLMPSSAEANQALLRQLSRREREVLALLAAGHSYQEVADSLAVSTKTVETYRTRLLQKLGARTRAELVRIALDTGLITPAR
jgi:two-component system response regulator NreC